MRASKAEAYEGAVRNYAKRVPASVHAKTYEAGLSKGILVGVCQALGIPWNCDPVKQDIQEARDALWVTTTREELARFGKR